jgi:hypothetical protein
MLSLDFGKTSILRSSCVYCPRAKSRDPQNIPEINLYWHRLFPVISIILSFTKHILTIQNHTPFLIRFLTVNYRLSRHCPPPITVSMYRFLFLFLLPPQRRNHFLLTRLNPRPCCVAQSTGSSVVLC